MVVQEDGEFELRDDEGVGEGDGGEAEGNVELERRGDSELGERAEGDGAGGVRGGERAQGVGGPGGAWRDHHLRLAPAWRERSQEDTLQVRPLSLSRLSLFLWYSLILIRRWLSFSVLVTVYHSVCNSLGGLHTSQLGCLVQRCLDVLINAFFFFFGYIEKDSFPRHES